MEVLTVSKDWCRTLLELQLPKIMRQSNTTTKKYHQQNLEKNSKKEKIEKKRPSSWEIRGSKLKKTSKKGNIRERSNRKWGWNRLKTNLMERKLNHHLEKKFKVLQSVERLFHSLGMKVKWKSSWPNWTWTPMATWLSTDASWTDLLYPGDQSLLPQ